MGLEHVLMITGRNKSALEDHFDRAFELEATLELKGDRQKLHLVDESTKLAEIHYVRQGDPNGLGHAVSKAETFVAGEPFALLLGDDLIGEQEDLLKQMILLAEEQSATVVALMEVPPSEVSMYGVADVAFLTGEVCRPIKGFVEKPEMSAAPSNLIVIGRYVLQPAVFDALRVINPGVGGEIQLTDALEVMAKNPITYGPVLGVRFSGRRFDTGDKFSYLKTIVEIASARDDLGAEFLSWLKRFVSDEKLTS